MGCRSCAALSQSVNHPELTGPSLSSRTALLSFEGLGRNVNSKACHTGTRCSCTVCNSTRPKTEPVAACTGCCRRHQRTSRAEAHQRRHFESVVPKTTFVPVVPALEEPRAPPAGKRLRQRLVFWIPPTHFQDRSNFSPTIVPCCFNSQFPEAIWGNFKIFFPFPVYGLPEACYN